MSNSCASLVTNFYFPLVSLARFARSGRASDGGAPTTFGRAQVKNVQTVAEGARTPFHAFHRARTSATHFHRPNEPREVTSHRSNALARATSGVLGGVPRVRPRRVERRFPSRSAARRATSDHLSRAGAGINRSLILHIYCGESPGFKPSTSYAGRPVVSSDLAPVDLELGS